MKLVTIIVIIYVVKSTEGCRRPPMKSSVTAPPGQPDWSKWDVPPYNEDWEGFVDLLGTREVVQNTSSRYNDDESFKDLPGFPDRWQNVGPGFPGQDPPAKAKVVGYIGQAAYCLDPGDKGTGNEWYLRWYYDNVRGRCRRFIYSGFGGNANKFLDKATCERNCRAPPRPCCVSEYLIDFEKFLDPYGDPAFS